MERPIRRQLRQNGSLRLNQAVPLDMIGVEIGLTGNLGLIL